MSQMVTDLLIAWGSIAFLGLAWWGIAWLAADPTGCRCQVTRSGTVIRNPRCPVHARHQYPTTRSRQRTWME